MKPPPLAAGAAAGFALALLLAPATGAALGQLAKARAERERLAQIAAVPAAAPPPLVVPAQAVAHPSLLVTRIRDRAKSGGVLVEQASLAAGEGRLIAVRMRVSGPEKSVIALADSLEREAPLVRLRNWRLIALADGGVRLTAEAVAARR